MDQCDSLRHPMKHDVLQSLLIMYNGFKRQTVSKVVALIFQKKTLQAKQTQNEFWD